MSDTGYTLIRQGHVCPKPKTPAAGTIIQCNECKQHWTYGTFFGWIRMSPKDDRLKAAE